ncbi:MAG: M23 family metallopeptidase, partial [Bdellovibrionaceae bacterium]|nr:M23 family metallopeptidase [Pseudobdellovibrionaceae bacterium]
MRSLLVAAGLLLTTSCKAGFNAASTASTAGNDAAAAPAPTPTPTPTPIGQCLPKDFPMLWPVGGTPYKDWIAHNFVDLNPLAGATLDYMGSTGAAAQTYDGHNGIDVDIASFRLMDNNFPILAVADGIVTETYASSFDRNLGGTIENCSKDPANFVKLLHANGYTTIYAHMKKNSIPVVVGQKVKAGDTLGVVGSSGCSTAPHIHLETYDCKGALIEPMKEEMFVNPPVYTLVAPTTIMDTFIHQPTFTDVKQLQDPEPEPMAVKAGQNFSVGFALANVK